MENAEAGNISHLLKRSIVSANSSLQDFTVELDDGSGLSLQAVEHDGEPSITASVLPACQLPLLNEAVCSVDWSWICGSTIKDIAATDNLVKLELVPAGPLKVGVGIWQGSAFLSFQPFRPPAR